MDFQYSGASLRFFPSYGIFYQGGELGFASADNYMWSETFLILLAMGRNILFKDIWG